MSGQKLQKHGDRQGRGDFSLLAALNDRGTNSGASYEEKGVDILKPLWNQAKMPGMLIVKGTKMKKRTEADRIQDTRAIIANRRMKERRRVATMWLVVALTSSLFGLFAYDLFGAEYEDFTVSGPQCSNCYLFYRDVGKPWSGPVEVLINESGALLTNGPVLKNEILWAISYIQRYIDIDISFGGFTETNPADGYEPSRQNTIVFYFDSLSWPTLGRAQLWWGGDGTGRLNQGQITIDTLVGSYCSKSVVLHELLHTLFITHSDVPDSIMSATPYHGCNYNKTLRLDDMQALQALYPAKPNREMTIIDYDDKEVCVYVPSIAVLGSDYQFEACIPASGFGAVIENGVEK